MFPLAPSSISSERKNHGFASVTLLMVVMLISVISTNGFSVQPTIPRVPTTTKNYKKTSNIHNNSQLQFLLSQQGTTGACATSTTSTSLRMTSSDDKSGGGLPFFFDISTKGGVVFYTILLFVVPIMAYQFATGVLGVDMIDAGRWIGVGFTVLCTLAWVSTYIFRVATKDMTYVS